MIKSKLTWLVLQANNNITTNITVSDTLLDKVKDVSKHFLDTDFKHSGVSKTRFVYHIEYSQLISFRENFNDIF